MSKIRIMAVSKEEWDEINDQLQLLHPHILEQVEWAEKGLGGIKYHVKKIFSDKPKLNLPIGIRNISDESGSIWAYGPGYAFVALKEPFMYNFVFIDYQPK